MTAMRFVDILAVIIMCDSVVLHFKTDGQQRNRLEARLPRQARTPIFPNYDDAQYNDNRNGAEMAGQITYRIITGEFYGFLRRRFFVSGFAFFDEERREAGRLRHEWCRSRIHRAAGGASSQADIPGGIQGILDAQRCGPRRAVSLVRARAFHRPSGAGFVLDSPVVHASPVVDATG
jgi:hypothetical protein